MTSMHEQPGWSPTIHDEQRVPAISTMGFLIHLARRSPMVKQFKQHQRVIWSTTNTERPNHHRVTCSWYPKQSTVYWMRGFFSHFARLMIWRHPTETLTPPPFWKNRGCLEYQTNHEGRSSCWQVLFFGGSFKRLGGWNFGRSSIWSTQIGSFCMGDLQSSPVTGGTSLFGWNADFCLEFRHVVVSLWWVCFWAPSFSTRNGLSKRATGVGG